MVLKKGKHGLNTGCSMKLCTFSKGSPLGQHSVLNKEYNHKTPAHRVIDTTHNIDSFVDDGNITACMNLFHSLNKHRRWKLLDILTEAVDDIRMVVDDKSCPKTSLGRLIVSHRHVTNNDSYKKIDPADCRSYHDSGAICSHVYPCKERSYGLDLRHKANKAEDKNQGKGKRQHPRHNQHSRGVQRKVELGRRKKTEEEGNRDGEELEAWLEECEYIIYDEMTVTAHPRFNCHKESYDCRITKAKHNKNKMDFTQPSWMDPWLDTEEVVDEEEETVTDEVPTRVHLINLTDMMTANRRESQSRKKKMTMTMTNTASNVLWSANTASTCVKVHGKGAAIYEPKEVSSSEDDDMSFVSDESGMSSLSLSSVSLSSDWLRATLTSFSSLMEGGSLCQESLVMNFGEAYREGRSLPRRFSVDLSQLIAQSTDGKSGIDGETCVRDEMLVFYPGHVHSQLTASQYVRVQLESNRPTNQSLFDHLQETFGCLSNVYTVGDLVQETIQYLTLFYSRHAAMQHHDVADTQPRLDNGQEGCLVSYVNSLHGCKTHIYSKDCSLLTDKCLDPASSSQQMQTVTSVGGHHNHSGNYCNICFSFIDSDSRGILQGTALLPCQHWFCSECWWQHLVERIRRGDLSIACPGHECETKLDPVTLLSLTSLGIYAKHKQHIASATVDQSRTWQWCPSTKCGQLAHVTTPSTDNAVLDVGVECTCGATWCFQCQQVFHWPAPCSQMETYMKLVKKRMQFHFHDATYFAYVKKCPKCHHPMEKAGGCQHMECRCGFEFCWECLAAWSDHGAYLVCPKSHVRLTVIELDNANELSANEWYIRRAMQHHKAGLLRDHSITTKRITALIKRQQIIYLNKKMQKTHSQSTSSQSPQQTDSSLHSLKTFNTFIVQMHKFLECMCVLLAACHRKTRNQGLEKKVSLLEFLLQRMEESLGQVRMGNVSRVFMQLNVLVVEQKSIIQRAAPDMRRTQRAVIKKTLS